MQDGAKTYTYGLGNLSQTDGSNTSYFLTDRLGSTRQLVNADSQIALTEGYDPFGSLMGSTGSDSSIFAFAGQQTDPSGLQYLRARYYDPSAGRFLNQDPFPGYAGLPQSQNPYAYALNNPIRYADPSGNCFTGLMVDTAACAGAAAAIIDFAIQLDRHNGNLKCIDWGEVGATFGATFVATLFFIPVFDLLIPIAGASLMDYVIAGGIANAIAGQAYRYSYSEFSGQNNYQFRVDDVITDFATGMIGGAVGYGIQGAAESLLGGLGEFGYYDEMLNPSMGHEGYYTGEFRPTTLNGTDILDPNYIRFTQESYSLTGRTSTGGIYFVEDNVNWLLEHPGEDPPWGEPIRVFVKTPDMDAWGPLEKTFGENTYAGDPINLENGKIYTLDNRRLVAYSQAGRDAIPVQWVDDLNLIEMERFKFSTPNFGISILPK